jgi:formylglycine-generating enzyme required for sulfatase activity
MTKKISLDLGGGVTIELLKIPEGQFLLGSNPKIDKLADKSEQPQHPIKLDEYWIGKYPIVNSQYNRFLSDTGYPPPDHWMEKDEIDDFDACPVTNISWDDARAFCYWVYWRTKSFVCIPTEPEWEKAARGETENIYPWGNQLLSKDLKPIGFEKQQAVGKYSPKTDSPYGCVDMVTNVAEICNTLRHKGFLSFYRYPYSKDDGRENCQARSQRSLKGGALTGMDATAAKLRCSNRDWIVPDYKSYGVGFRIIVTKSKDRWNMAFPDENEKSALERKLNLQSINLKEKVKEISGYDVLGIKWSMSGVYVRGDDLKEISALIKKLQKDYPNLKCESIFANSDSLPGKELLRVSKLSGKDRLVSEWLLAQLTRNGWSQYKPEIKRVLTLAQQFDMKPTFKPEEEWSWLRKPKIKTRSAKKPRKT